MFVKESLNLRIYQEIDDNFAGVSKFTWGNLLIRKLLIMPTGFYGKVTKRKPLLKESQLWFNTNHVGDMWMKVLWPVMTSTELVDFNAKRYV